MYNMLMDNQGWSNAGLPPVQDQGTVGPKPEDKQNAWGAISSGNTTDVNATNAQSANAPSANAPLGGVVSSGATGASVNFGQTAAQNTPAPTSVSGQNPFMTSNSGSGSGVIDATAGLNLPSPEKAVESKEDKKRKFNMLVETIILVVVCIVAATAIVFAAIYYMNWKNLKANLEVEKVAISESAAKKQKDLDDANFLAKEKEPNMQFAGPSDYGTLSFYYPKTWSLYVSEDGRNNSDYVAYFRPIQVDPIGNRDSRYALRLSIVNRQIGDVQRSYANKVTDGDLAARQFKADDSRVAGTIYEGKISEEIDGEILLIKINDKTAILQADAKIYKQDFEKLIKTLRRNS